MRLLSVAPLVSGFPHEELSYFSKDDIVPGDLVEIQIKRRNIRGLVLSSIPAAEERQSLRHASFTTKKISKLLIKNFLSPSLWKSLEYISSYTLTPIGRLIYDLIPEQAFSTLTTLITPPTSRGSDLYLLQQAYDERITRYKTTIRESFSKKQTLVIFFPTITDIEHAKTELSRGIDDYVVVLHSGLTEKQAKTSYDIITHEEHPILILATPTIIPWQRQDLGSIIIEREHSHYYYTHGSKSYDMRYVLEQLARESNIPCTLGSHMLSLRAHMLYRKKEAYEVIPIHFRNDIPIEIIPMTDANKTSSPFLSRKALTILHEAKLEERGHIFIYAHRKGMYPTTVCLDCGTLFTCPTCERPYVLHKIAGVRTYVCHECEHIVRLDEDTTLSCRHCGGWRMQTLGIATTGIEEELERLGIPLYVIDGERTTTRAKIKKVYKEWEDAPYGVLIGTEMAHNSLTRADHIIILSMDSLFSLPEYRTDEKILTLVTEMGEKIRTFPGSSHKLLFQTRLPKNSVIGFLSSYTLLDMYNALLKEREDTLLPPHYIIIKATFDNLPDQLRTRMEQELEPYVVEWYEAGKGVTLLFIHIKETEWAHNTPIRERIWRIVYNGNPEVNPLSFFSV